LSLTLLAFLALAFAAGFAAYQLWGDSLVHGAPAGGFGVFWESWDLVEDHFFGQIPSVQDRTYGAIRGALTTLDDPYTIFVEPQPRELERDRMRGSFGGIGVTIYRDGQEQVVLSPHPDTPAVRAGVREGDVLLQVDDHEITGQTSVDDVRAWLHGEVGTEVTLTISRPPTPPFELTITREEIQVPSTTWRVLDQAPDVGYVRIESFTERTGDEVVAALEQLLEAGVSSLILDLRGNAGGLLDPAVATASQFLRDGVVLIEQGRDGVEKSFPVQPGGLATDLPLAVLVDGGTASAAEIVAGALQDTGRAPLIGESTFGKGAVQLIYELSDGSSLHVTSAVWLTPGRHQIEGQGLAPDVEVAPGDGPEDEPLARALDILRPETGFFLKTPISSGTNSKPGFFRKTRFLWQENRWRTEIT
jgi:carboxyl-terminal processing protease